MSAERELLAEVKALLDNDGANPPKSWDKLHKRIAAFLSKPVGPVAEMFVVFERSPGDGSWSVGELWGVDAKLPTAVKVRIPVPSHIHSPKPVIGEVIE